MDPNACYERMIDALNDNDLGEAYNAAGDLLAWISGNGFLPQAYRDYGYTRMQAVHSLAGFRDILRSAKKS